VNGENEPIFPKGLEREGKGEEKNVDLKKGTRREERASTLESFQRIKSEAHSLAWSANKTTTSMAGVQGCKKRRGSGSRKIY